MNNKHQPAKTMKLVKSFLVGFVICFTLGPGTITYTKGGTLPDSGVVVADNNFPPFIFRDNSGNFQGIIPEQWVLGEEQTGININPSYAAILSKKIQAIGRKWRNLTFKTSDVLWPWRYGFITTAVLIIVLLLTYIFLHHKTKSNQTKQAVLEQKLTENHALIQQFFLHSPICNFIQEFSDSGVRFVMASENFQAFTGRPSSECIGKTVDEVFAGQPLTGKIFTQEKPAIEEKIVSTSEFTLMGRDFILKKHPIKREEKTLIAGFIIDVTDRNKAEKEKSEAVFRYHTLANQNAIITWVLNCEGHLKAVSENVTKITGHIPAEILNQLYFTNNHIADDSKNVTTSMQRKLSKGKPLHSVVHAAKNKSGTSIWFSTSSIPLFNGDGSLKGAWGTSRDITSQILKEKGQKENQNRYRILTENMKDVVWIVDPETFEYLYLSPSIRKLRGYAPEELLGKDIGQSLPFMQAQVFKKHLSSMAGDFRAKRITTETFFITELRETHKNGTMIRVEVLAHFWENTTTGKLEVHGSTRNIDQRKRIEYELNESRRKYAALLGRLPGMAYRSRVDQNMTIEFTSAGCKEVTGYVASELIGNAKVTYRKLIKPDSRPYLETKWVQAIREHKRFEEEYQIKAKTGEWRWVWERAEAIYTPGGAPLAVEGFISDITARRQAVAERERLLSAIEQTGESIIITDEHANIIYVNPACCVLSGYTKEEIIGKNPRIFKSGRQSSSFYKKMWNTLLAGKTWNGKFENVSKNGTVYTESVTISPALNTSGETIGYIAVKRDISQQIEAEKERTKLQTQLIQSQKLESVGRLAGGIAHDFNNMLQAILGYTEMALVQATDNRELCEDLSEIKKATLRSTHLTRKLLAFARKQPVVMKEIDLNKTVNGMLNMLRRVVGENITIEAFLADELDIIKIDKNQLEQIILNLCINAQDAISKFGKIQITTTNKTFTADDSERPKMLNPGRYVKLTVKDTGIGIPNDMLERVFEPFFTTKKIGDGTGLGLSVVYGSVTQAGGTIIINSKIGKGSAFHIYLPGFGQPNEKPLKKNKKDKKTGGQTVGILLVDDEERILKPTQQLLKSLGHHVFAAQSAHEAIGLMEQHLSEIDLVLSDVVMPGMSGPEMIEKLQAVKPDIKYIFMSGHTANLIKKQGLSQNSSNFIEKPFSRQQLDDVICKMLQS